MPGPPYRVESNISGQKSRGGCRFKGVEARIRREPAQTWSELPGEDLTTSALPEVAGWISIYEEMGAVLRSVISRTDGSADMEVLRHNLQWIDERLGVWRDRHAALAGVALDRKDHTLIYGGKSLRLTRREADLLDFLLRHPRTSFTSKQLATLAWQNSRLSDAQVRTYIMRLRGRLRDIGLGESITVVRNRGYGMAANLGGGKPGS